MQKKSIIFCKKNIHLSIYKNSIKNQKLTYGAMIDVQKISDGDFP